MKRDSGNTISIRLVLFLIGLALLGSLIAGIDYTENILPDEKAVAVHQGGIGALFFNKCLYICTLSLNLCMRSNPYKIPFHNTTCHNEQVTCNATCVESHTVPQ